MIVFQSILTKRLKELNMSTVSQKESVINEVKAILGSSFNSGAPARDLLTDDQLKVIRANIISGILNGTIDFGKEKFDEKEVSKYVSGMVSNYLRKSKELNGGLLYVPQSAGRGSRDPQISELNKLLKTYSEGSEEFAQIITAIEARKTALNAEKTFVVKEKKKSKEFESINMDALPENLKSLASNLVNQISK
jgi:hypothetical protein